MNTNWEYEVAISFAGEDRVLAKEIADKLRSSGITVFYDEFEETSLWGRNLYDYLHEIYSKKARYCIMLISQYYAKKMWTNHERKSAQERAFKESEAYILPVRLDDTPIPGLHETVGYISLKQKSVDQLVQLIVQKLDRKSSQIRESTTQSVDLFNIPLQTVSKKFTQRDKDKFLEISFEEIRKYFAQGVNEINQRESFEADLKEINSNRFVCRVYVGGSLKAACTIWLGGSFGMHGINYLHGAHAESTSSLNESLSVAIDASNLYLKPLMNVYLPQFSDKLSVVEGAEYLWTKLIEQIR